MKIFPVHILTRLDARPIPSGAPEVRLFATIRNELLRLPYFLEYHRKLGVSRFIFVDNGSSDGTQDYLLQQPDCHILSTTDSYGEAKSGVRWQNRVLDTYGTGHWCLFADADEFLVYPQSETVPLPQLCAYLDSKGYEGLYTFMLDMYSDKEMSKAVYNSGQNPVDVCPMFDTDYHFVPRPFLDQIRMPNRPPPFPDREVIGGPRVRVFYPEQNTPDVWPRIKPRLLGIVMRLLHKLKLVSKDSIPHMASLLFKVPLVKWRKGFAYYSSTHILTALKLADITGVLLHFKFFSDFYEKAVLEAGRGQYSNGGRQYRHYARVLEESSGTTAFHYTGSARYAGSQDLVARKLLTSTPDYEAFVAKPEGLRHAG
jgi:hypothetical protein